MNTYSKTDFEKFESRYRARFFNSIVGYKPISLIGTTDSEGNENVALFSRLVHIGSRPAYIGVVFRPHSVRRDTFENIRQTKQFTINHIHEGMYKQAHQTAAKYDALVSEFEKTGLTPAYGTLNVPYVKEAKVRIGLEFAEEQEIKVNKTILVIGRVIEVQVNPQFIKNDGFVDINGAGSMLSSNIDAYYTARKVARLDYPQPEKEVSELAENLF